MAEFFENAPEGFRYQDLQGDESWPARPMAPGVYDGAVEEVLHLVSGYGWGGVWPEIFGECFEGEDPGGSAECAGSLLAQQMDRQIGDCGFAFNGTFVYPDCSGFYHYEDETCNYPCLFVEYTYWSFTSMLGGQTAPLVPGGRCGGERCHACHAMRGSRSLDLNHACGLSAALACSDCGGVAAVHATAHVVARSGHSRGVSDPGSELADPLARRCIRAILSCWRYLAERVVTLCGAVAGCFVWNLTDI